MLYKGINIKKPVVKNLNSDRFYRNIIYEGLVKKSQVHQIRSVEEKRYALYLNLRSRSRWRA